MTKEELININGIREDLYQAMQIGDITLSSKDSQKLVDFMNYQDKEIERLNNIINDLLKRQNEALNYISNFLSMDNRYKHGNGNDELELVRRILNKHNQELKGSDSNVKD